MLHPLHAIRGRVDIDTLDRGGLVFRVRFDRFHPDELIGYIGGKSLPSQSKIEFVELPSLDCRVFPFRP